MQDICANRAPNRVLLLQPAINSGGVMMKVTRGKSWLGRLCGLWLALFSIQSIIGSPLQADDWTPSTSEEQGEASPALCGSGLVSGLRCSGRYCDNVALKCSSNAFLGERSWAPYVSDEGTTEYVCPDGRFVDGVRCTGRYCDNLSVR